MKVHAVRRVLATILRSFGYCMVILAWLWITVIIIPPLIQNGTFDLLLPNHAPAPPSLKPATSASLSPFAGGLAIVFAVLMILLTIVTLWRLPKVVTNRGDRAVGMAADAILPVVTHHKKLPVARKHRLSRKLALFIQMIACVTPLLIVPWLQPPGELTRLIIITIGAGCACAGVLAFALAFVIDGPISRIRSPVSRE